jgi:hypothetical protein
LKEIGINDIAERLENGQNMTLHVSQSALDCLSEAGYDFRYGARPLRRILARDVLNPLSRLVLEGAVIDGDTVRVCTRGEAERDQDGKNFGYITSSTRDDDKNAVVIMRNHDCEKVNDSDLDSWDDEEYLLEDGTHHHR